MTLNQRRAIADEADKPQMACSDSDLRARFLSACRIWNETREPLAIAQYDRLLDEHLRRKRFNTHKKHE